VKKCGLRELPIDDQNFKLTKKIDKKGLMLWKFEAPEGSFLKLP
jgi:hypothetical protein